MRRDFRKNNSTENKIITYAIAGTVLSIVIAIGLLIYGNSINKKAQEGQLNSEQIASILKNETDTESASSSIGKSIEEEEKKREKENAENKNEIVMTKTTDDKKQDETTNISTPKNTNTQKTTSNANAKPSTNNNATEEETKATAVIPESTKVLEFKKPIEGDIIKEYAKDQLIFSKTLQEWVTHTGIDIKANETAVVQAAEEGTIKTIKNDPRYGLTIVIEHENGFETMYANLLSSEFVKEGEKVEKGQSIGTVGKTAAFESADEPHLHFEIIKDSLSVDPSIYIK